MCYRIICPYTKFVNSFLNLRIKFYELRYLQRLHSSMLVTRIIGIPTIIAVTLLAAGLYFGGSLPSNIGSGFVGFDEDEGSGFEAVGGAVV